MSVFWQWIQPKLGPLQYLMVSLPHHLSTVIKVFSFGKFLIIADRLQSNGSSIKTYLRWKWQAWRSLFGVFVIKRRVNSYSQLSTEDLAKEWSFSMMRGRITSWGWAGPSSGQAEIGLKYTFGFSLFDLVELVGWALYFKLAWKDLVWH